MLRTWLQRLTGVRRDEVVPVVLMVSYGFLAMTSYYLVRPARNSIFVERVGAENLPWIYVLTAVFVTLAVAVYSRWVERIGERRLLLGTFGLLAGSMVCFWWVLSRDVSVWSSGAFYVWVKLYPLLLVSQFWLVGNLVFTTRQGRRVFGALGMGLIVGGIAGSAITGFSVPRLGTEPLLLVAAAALGGAALVCLLLFPRMDPGRGTGARLLEEFSGDALRILVRSSHLRTIAVILGLTIVVSTLLDWQLNRAVELAVPGEDGMTRFWGYFYMAVNVASVTIQGLVTGFVLRRWGIGVAILVLPAVLLGLTVGVLAVPALLAVALAKGLSDALRYSLDQSTREVLYLPVPSETKYKVKPLIDLAVYRGGTGIGGVLLLVAVNGLGFGLREVAGMTVVLVLAWAAAAVRMRGEYVDVLARSIRTAGWGTGPVLDPPVERRARGIDEPETALAADGAGMPALERILRDREAEPSLRRRIAAVLGRTPVQGAVDALSRLLESGGGDASTELWSLRSLSRLRRGEGTELRFDRELASSTLERQLDAADAYRAAGRNLRKAVGPRIRSDARPEPVLASSGDGLELLIRAVEEAWRGRREAAFEALGLLHPSEGVRTAYRALTSDDPSLRSKALEWLEHTIDLETFARMEPVLAEEAGARAPASPRPRLEELLYGLWHDESPAVACVALWAAERTSAPDVERRLRIFHEDAAHPTIRGLAGALLERRRSDPEAAGALDPVERAVVLQRAEPFAAADPSPLLDLARLARVRHVTAGAEVPRPQGRPLLHVVGSGRVEVTLPGGERTTLGGGEAFTTGLPDDGSPHGVLAARAVVASRLLVVGRDDVDRLLTGERDGSAPGPSEPRREARSTAADRDAGPR